MKLKTGLKDKKVRNLIMWLVLMKSNKKNITVQHLLKNYKKLKSRVSLKQILRYLIAWF
jgi:hypothetical protein